MDIRDKDFQFIGADESITGKPIALKNNYSIDGGISELFLEYSRKLSPHYSGGIKYSFLFGNQYLDNKLYTYDVVIDTTKSGFLISEIVENDKIFYVQYEDSVVTELNKFRKFSGSTLMIEGRYKGSNHECVMSASINGRVRVETQNIQTACIS